MLAQHPVMAFAATRDAVRARRFYEDVLGLRLISDEPWALVFDANGIMFRVQKVDDFTPQPFTTLGWRVPDLRAAIEALRQHGLRFERYPGFDQDERDIWTAPGGGRVAWFKDPDGNTLSLTQFEERNVDPCH
jgi:catechol 2,3-dioxygenase-like lactoylglutathione lyase family enzyme